MGGFGDGRCNPMMEATRSIREMRHGGGKFLSPIVT